MSPEEKIVQRHVDALGEHFEAVQILASRTTVHGTESVFLGSGNWYSRTGMAADFLKRDEATTLADKMPKPPPEEGEDWKQD